MFLIISEYRKEIEERRNLDHKIEDLPHKFNHLVDLINDRYFDGQEVFHIQVSDYKDIRQLEKARKRTPELPRSTPLQSWNNAQASPLHPKQNPLSPKRDLILRKYSKCYPKFTAILNKI